METVIDSVSMNHLVRKPKNSRKHNSNSRLIELTCLDEFIKSGALVIVLDSERAVQSEWERTCNEDEIRMLVSFWGEYGGIRIIENVPNLDRRTRDELRRNGFNDTIDKFLLRLTVSSAGQNLTSDDPDFWDPSNARRNGDKNARMARLIEDLLGINLMVLGQLVSAFD